MSLTQQQKLDTILEFQENMSLANLTIEAVAEDFQVAPEKITRILQLQQNSIEDPWILKEYLAKKVEEAGQVPVPFTALVGDYHQYWFLNTRKIDKMKLSRGNA
ncbi:DUF2316 family protein [Candidatus Enterococcus ferrettii]|uniref:DUF2316 family protein n=1 Tax=Candidatus Enterococcus ferrettii TaxID=2815324 RepID=A0ABV0EW11_9ENTE|nr:DUF2316 family protein [Enterococcus sp. 665A]MBO1341751.1 DUF2316 family protein [Enterococcus sp. 665A]